VLAATLRGELFRAPVALFRRAIPAEVVRRAGAVLTLSAAVVLAAAFLLSLTEEQSFLAVLFEATSAFGTVGLTTGITAQLGILGKLIITGTMFIGRVGPFTLALAAGSAEAHAHYRLAEERLIVG
jgi:trk system potassium uptake protein